MYALHILIYWLLIYCYNNDGLHALVIWKNPINFVLIQLSSQDVLKCDQLG